MYDWKKVTNGFNFVFDEKIPGNTTEILKMPVVSANKRGINDIGFTVGDGVRLYATLSIKPDIEDEEIWQEIEAFDEINKTTSYIKIVNTADAARRVIIRVILN